jgi:DNA-binding transcriptional ArsR family regulator
MSFNTYHLFFRNLSNALKIRIVSELREKDLSVNELVDKTGVEQSKISHALKSLKNCRIVSSKRKGKQIIYSLNKDTIIPILKLIDRHAVKHCECASCSNKTCGGRNKKS